MRENAILFTGGDAEANSLWYLQFVKCYRRDVSVIPLGLLPYSPFVKFAERGTPDFFVSVPVGLTDKEIAEMRPHLYREDSLFLAVPDKIKKQYNLKKNYVMRWQLKPDYVFRGKKIIVPGTDILSDILKNNRWERPIYFTAGSQPNLRANLGDYLRTEGLCLHLLPVKKEKAIFIEPNITAMVLMNKKDLKDYPTVKKHDMTRCSMILTNYTEILLELYNYYNGVRRYSDARKTLIFIKNNVDTGVIKYGREMRSHLDSLYNKQNIGPKAI